MPNFKHLDNNKNLFTNVLLEYIFNECEKYRVTYGKYTPTDNGLMVRSVNWSKYICVQTDFSKFAVVQNIAFFNTKMQSKVFVNGVLCFVYTVDNVCNDICIQTFFNLPPNLNAITN